MTLQKAFEVIRNNENAIEKSFFHYLHECSEFNKQAYKEYYHSLKALVKGGEDYIGKYCIQEIKTNNSLQLNQSIIDVSIDYAGQTVTKTTVNKTTSIS